MFKTLSTEVNNIVGNSPIFMENVAAQLIMNEKIKKWNWGGNGIRVLKKGGRGWIFRQSFSLHFKLKLNSNM